MRNTEKSKAPPTRQAAPFNTKANNELLFKGVMLAVIGLAVLISPGFISAPDMRATVAGAALVGWFALILGAAFIAQSLARRWAADKARGLK